MPTPGAAVEVGEGWTVLLVAVPTPPADRHAGLSECERDCLTLLAQANEPLSGCRTRTELRRLGVVANSRHRPRGCYLPDCPPLFRRPTSLV